MAAAPLTQLAIKRVIGASRLMRLVRAGWLAPIGRNGNAILYAPRDVHAALRRLERKFCPPDRIEVARIRDSERRHNRSYVPHPRPLKPGIGDPIELDWNRFNL